VKVAKSTPVAKKAAGTGTVKKEVSMVVIMRFCVGEPEAIAVLRVREMTVARCSIFPRYILVRFRAPAIPPWRVPGDSIGIELLPRNILSLSAFPVFRAAGIGDDSQVVLPAAGRIERR
jgi:hypothetical protein